MHRTKKSRFKPEPIELREVKPRCKISAAKTPLLTAIKKVINDLEEFLPLTLRQIFYALLNDPPLLHASKPDSRFSNDSKELALKSYKTLTGLLRDARHEGLIPYEHIHDETRIDVVWNTHADLASYYDEQIDDLLNDYHRDLMQSQENFFQIFVEKNTLNGIVRPIASKFTIPYQTGRGQTTTSPVWKIAQRYKASGKDKLIILSLSDLDPDGDAITHAIGQRLRDDHAIDNVEVYKVALTMQQVRDPALRLSQNFLEAKETSPNYKRYVERYDSSSAWELEAVPPRTLQQMLEQHINALIDQKAFKRELAQEREDAERNDEVRERVIETLRDAVDEDDDD